MKGASLNTTSVSVLKTDSLVIVSQFIQGFVLSIYMIFGFIGNTVNIFIFVFTALSRTSSSLYLLSASIVNLLVTVFVLPIRLAADVFNRDITDLSLFSCRLISYLHYNCLALPPLFTLFACADRWAASCVQVNRRQFARTYIAKRAIVLIILLCCLLYSYILVTFTAEPIPPPPYCSIDDTYAIFGLTFQLLVYSLIPPFFTTLFSLGIIYNVVEKRKQIVPTVHGMNIPATDRSAVRRRNTRGLNQLQVMLVCQSIAGCVFTLPFSVINFVSLFVQNNQYFLSIFSYMRLFVFINYIVPFYIYVFSSKLYRDESKKMIRRIYHRH